MKRILNIIIQAGILERTEISASEDLNALEKAPPQIMPLQILSRKGEVQIMLFRKLSGKFHFLLRFWTYGRQRSKMFKLERM